MIQFLLYNVSGCRDGRQLREDAKPREMLALDRFASKGGGLMGYDSTLDDLGLHDLAPPNACRPTQPTFQGSGFELCN